MILALLARLAFDLAFALAFAFPGRLPRVLFSQGLRKAQLKHRWAAAGGSATLDCGEDIERAIADSATS